MDDNTLDFNFWPSFSDLMLTLVLILVIVVFAVIAAFSIGTDDLRAELKETKEKIAIFEDKQKEIAEAIVEVEKKQEAIIKAIAAEYNVQWKNVKKWDDAKSKTNFFKIPISLVNGDYSEIQVQNEATLQRYSFSDRILFRRNKYDLNEEGKRTLRVVGQEIKKNLKDIKEIQIQGHADPDRPADDYFFNIDLAASRAIEVYKFLQRSIRIDPAKHLMSATSFGEYKPVQRLTDDRTYNRQKLMQHNNTLALKAKNRRIEILLFYRLEHAAP